VAGRQGSRHILAARLLRVKSFALILVMLWWAQGPICALPGASHTHESAAATHAGADHGEQGPAPRPAGHQHQRPNSDSGCEEHCASLAQAVTPQTPQAQQPSGPGLALLAARPVLHGSLRLASRVEGAPEAPPPDLLLRTSVLRL